MKNFLTILSLVVISCTAGAAPTSPLLRSGSKNIVIFLSVSPSGADLLEGAGLVCDSRGSRVVVATTDRTSEGRPYIDYYVFKNSKDCEMAQRTLADAEAKNESASVAIALFEGQAVVVETSVAGVTK